MNELNKTTEIKIVRTPELIAAEINNIKSQTRKIVLYNSVEIGRKLVEAKELINHGEWGAWLEKSVDYSQSTANNLMRIFNEYGSEQITLLEDNSKSQSLGNLSYTQALVLLGIPLEEREDFVKENDIDNMSTRELQKVIKERDEALQRADKKSQEAKKLFDEKCKVESTLRTTDEVFRKTQYKADSLEKALQLEKDKSEERLKNLNKTIAENRKLLSEAKASGDAEEVKRLQASLQEIQSDLDSSAKKIDELEAELKTKTIDVITAKPVIIEKVPEEIEKELQELRTKNVQGSNTSVTEFKVYFKYLNETFEKELKVMSEIKESNLEIYEKCKSNILKLINSMSEHL